MARSSSGNQSAQSPSPTQGPGQPHPPRTSSARRVVRSGADPTYAIRARIAQRTSGTTTTASPHTRCMRTGMRGGMHSGDDPMHGSAARIAGLGRGTTLTYSFRAAVAALRLDPGQLPIRDRAVLRILNRARLANAEQLGILVYRNRHYAQVRPPEAVGSRLPRAIRPPTAVGHQRVALRSSPTSCQPVLLPTRLSSLRRRVARPPCASRSMRATSWSRRSATSSSPTRWRSVIAEAGTPRSPCRPPTAPPGSAGPRDGPARRLSPHGSRPSTSVAGAALVPAQAPRPRFDGTAAPGAERDWHSKVEPGISGRRVPVSSATPRHGPGRTSRTRSGRGRSRRARRR